MPKTINRTAALVRYAKLEGIGWRRGSLVTSKNGRIKPDAMEHNGVEYAIPADSHFQIRHYVGTKTVYTTVGSDHQAAQAMLDKFLASRQLEAAQSALGIITPKATVAIRTLTEQANDYIAKKKSPSLNLSMTSINLYETTLTAFIKHCGRIFASDVTEADVVGFVDWLKREGYEKDGQRKGYSEKSLLMRYTVVRGFLRSVGVQVEKVIDSATHKRLATKPEQNTDPYTQAHLDRFLTACDDYHRIVFTFLLQTGLRYREASHLTWTNVDFERRVINVPGTQRINRRFRERATGKTIDKAVEFKSKSRKGREVPMFPSLRALLAQWRKDHPDTVYVFGTRSDLPDGHWWEHGKQIWREAGLNCGTCDGCAKNGECEEFYLHRFRHSFAHATLDGSVPIHKVSKWMGHHSIEVTAIYLSGGSLESDKDPFARAA